MFAFARSSLLVFLVLLIASAAMAQAAAELDAHPMIGEVAPEFQLERVNGEPLSLEDLKGKYIVMHFGASW